MSKMGSHDPFNYLKHKLWPKKRLRVKFQFDFRSLKVKNCLDLLVHRWCATYRSKAFDEGYNFASNLTLIGGLHKKLCSSKVIGDPS
jgi:hypothetical protein